MIPAEELAATAAATRALCDVPQEPYDHGDVIVSRVPADAPCEPAARFAITDQMVADGTYELLARFPDLYRAIKAQDPSAAVATAVRAILEAAARA